MQRQCFLAWRDLIVYKKVRANYTTENVACEYNLWEQNRNRNTKKLDKKHTITRRSHHSCTRAPWPTPERFIVPRDLDLWTFDPKINEFPELMVEHVYVRFGDLTASVFEISCRKKQIDRQTHRQTNTQTPLKTLPTRLLSACVRGTSLHLQRCKI